MTQVSTIPVFVVDRPASLRILGGLTENKGEFGILAHAFTTKNFKKQFSEFNLAAFKVGDSGIYQRNDQGYREIFSAYNEMKVDYGIIKDFYRDRKKTFESAKIGFGEYKKGKYNFILVGVAQGRSVAEYIQSYREQKDLGLEIVAIGGLLDKIPNHVRLVKVKHDVMLRNVLRAIRKQFPNDKLFPLGAFSRKRIQFFKEVGVWASDYKGWIFKYDKSQAEAKNDRFEQTRKYVIEKVLSPLSESNATIYDDTNHKLKNDGKRLLIMACGKVKRNERDNAINVYDGPSFKVVRKYLKTGNNHLDVKIISAKYGLIDSKDKISPYDLKMDAESTKIYAEIYGSDLKGLVSKYDEVFLLGGKNYQSIIPIELDIKRAAGKIGEQLSQLKAWLNETCKSKDDKVKLNQ
jgi:hypothetical protein